MRDAVLGPEPAARVEMEEPRGARRAPLKLRGQRREQLQPCRRELAAEAELGGGAGHPRREQRLCLIGGQAGEPRPVAARGERQLEEGAVVHFPLGPDGAHELRNGTDEPVRYIVAGIRVSPEVAEYPDLKQLTAQSWFPSQTGGPLFVIHDVKDEEA
jgi:hypothetical protein